MEKLIKISDVCKVYGLTTRTLRYYEEMGLIESCRSEAYTYRMYDEKNMQRIREIVVLRKLDISIKNIMIIYNEANTGFLTKVIRQKLHEIDEQVDSLTELRKLLSAFVENIQRNQSILTGMELAEEKMQNNSEEIEEPEENQFDLTRFVELCSKTGRHKDFVVLKLGPLKFDYSNVLDVECLRAECGRQGYFVFDSAKNCFGIATSVKQDAAQGEDYAVTVVQGEENLQQALLAFGSWLNISMYTRAPERHYCLLKEIGDVETDAGVLPQLAVFFPVKPYRQREHDAADKLHPSVIINQLTEGFKMFKSTLTGQDIRPFAEAAPSGQLECYALPELRVIGKCMELEVNFKVNPLPEMWDNMFRIGSFQQLEQLPMYLKDSFVALCDYRKPGNGRFTYLAGALCPAGTEVPQGYQFADLHSTLGVLGRFGEKQSKVERGVKRTGLEKPQELPWSMEVYFDQECKGPAAGKNYGANSWRVLVPAFKKVE